LFSNTTKLHRADIKEEEGAKTQIFFEDCHCHPQIHPLFALATHLSDMRTGGSTGNRNFNVLMQEAIYKRSQKIPI
jgi:hypothetical protein